MSQNGISKIERLENLKKLKILDLSDNPVEHIVNVKELQNLEEFWLTRGKITSFEELKGLQDNKKLHTIFMEANPISTDPQYRNKIIVYLPQLLTIDLTDVGSSSLAPILKGVSKNS